MTEKLNIDYEALNAFKRMRAIATALFLVMVAIFIIAKIYEPKYHWVSYLRAFGEAAMVGALADWFAVTALFRHPLGLPIPHTAIIPKSKDRIGTGLGNFISRNFLQPSQVSRRLENIDLGNSIAQFLGNDERAKKMSDAIAGAIPRLFGLLKDGPIMDWLQSNIKQKLQTIDLPTLLADGLKLLTAKKRHIPIVDLIIFHADIAISQYEPQFREKVSANTNWLPKLFSVDDTASDALLSALKASLKDAASDPSHSLRNNIDDAISHFEYNLRNDEKLRNQIKVWQFEFSTHPTIGNYIQSIWQSIKNEIADNNDDRRANLSNAINGALKNISQSLIENDDLRDSIDTKLKEWAVEIAASQGDEVGRMVADTIRGWDASTVVTQIETAVGRDLQYIRINGTVIGGMVGLLIHIISGFIFK